MFDIAFSEIVVIAVVALIVIGPERLPKVARTLGHMFGRLQRYVNDVKADINREMELDELRKLKSEVQSAAQRVRIVDDKAAQEVDSGVRSVETELNDADRSPSATAPAAYARRRLARRRRRPRPRRQARKRRARPRCPVSTGSDPRLRTTGGVPLSAALQLARARLRVVLPAR